MTRFTQNLLSLFLLLAAASCALAQTSNGTLTGAVTDPTGAAIVGATVTVQSVDNGAIRVAQTLGNGSYRIESLLPGTYTVTVNSSGFAQTVVKNLVVPASLVTTSDIQLKLGRASDVIQVSADNSDLDTDNAQISGTINAKEIANLPLNSLRACLRSPEQQPEEG